MKRRTLSRRIMVSFQTRVEDRAKLDTLAKHLDQSRSGAVRYAIDRTFEELGLSLEGALSHVMEVFDGKA